MLYRFELFVVLFPAGVVEFTQSTSGSAQPGSHGPDRHPGGMGDLVVTQALPDEEDEGVVLGGRQFGDRVGDSLPTRCRIDGAADQIGHVVGWHPLGSEAGDRVDPSGLSPSMLGHQVRGDAVQPRASDGTPEVIGTPPFERDSNDIAEHRVGIVRADAPNEVPQQHRGVAIENHPETAPACPARRRSLPHRCPHPHPHLPRSVHRVRAGRMRPSFARVSKRRVTGRVARLG